jgi:hypothetical protein
MQNKFTNHFIKTTDSSLAETTSLHFLLDSMIKTSQNLAGNNNSRVLNEVSFDICLADKNEKMLSVINELLKAVISNSRNSEICIAAERFRDLVILHIQDRNNYNGYALGFSVQSIEPEAADAGAYIHFKEQQKRVATISLSFSNHFHKAEYNS